MEPRKNSIRERAKKIPLEVRLYLNYIYEWYLINNKNFTCHSLTEEQLASKWAKKMTSDTINQIEKWQADGAELKSKKYNGKA